MVFLTVQIGNSQTVKEIEEINRVLRERVAVGKTNQSIVVALIDEKRTRFTGYGKTAQTTDAENADENTVFEIGSVTKVFTGTLLAEAVRRGEVALDDPISKYLPKTVKTPLREGKEITLLDLATHSSGLPGLPTNFAPKDAGNPYSDYTVAQMYEFLSNYQLTRDIGTKYEYSNFGMGLLGHVLSLRAGMNYEDLVKTRILKPLKMNDTIITLSPRLKSRMAQGFDESGDAVSNWDIPTLAGAGALRSTAKDMAKFIGANLNLRKSGLESAFAEAHKERRSAGGKMKIGLAWHILPNASGDIVWHNGGTGGFRSFAGFSGTRKKGIVVLTNTSESVDDIGFNFLDPTIALRKVKPFVGVAEQVLEAYVGTYQFAPNVFLTVTRNSDRLFAQLTGQSRLRVFASADNEFYYRAVDARLTFNRGADGETESLTLHQNGEQTARRVK